jgi:apolipoprotein D and lipocalin family protein
MDIEIPSTGTEVTPTLSSLIEECEDVAKNLGNYQSCVSKLTNEWKKDGLITGREKGAIQSCATQFKPTTETVDSVDVVSFTGKWYQIARYFNPAEGVLAAVTAEYTLNDNGTLDVLNTGRVGGLNGPEVVIEGFARVVDEKTNSKLAVSFTNPPVDGEFEFWIIELGDIEPGEEKYPYAVISNSKRSTLYIISRTPTMEASVYQGILDRLARKCFDLEKIILTPQFPETVEFVDIERYMGLWYEIARYPVPFDEDAEAVTALYELNDNRTVSLTNSGVLSNGATTEITGTARVVDEVTNAKLAVTFDRPDLEGIEFPYWIIELDEVEGSYERAAVSSDTRFTLYILNREPTMANDDYEDLLNRLVKKGFDVDKLELTPQP